MKEAFCVFYNVMNLRRTVAKSGKREVFVLLPFAATGCGSFCWSGNNFWINLATNAISENNGRMEVVFKYYICGVQITYLWCFCVIYLHDPVVGSFPKLKLVYNGSAPLWQPLYKCDHFSQSGSNYRQREMPNIFFLLRQVLRKIYLAWKFFRGCF